MKDIKNHNIKIAVVGGGHAGVEASLAISRMGMSCYMITMSEDTIGRMSCNPAIGGLAKGHLVREIDALGGIMGVAADECAIQFKTLNKSKGRAVWSPRAQVDKLKYSAFIKSKVLSNKKIHECLKNYYSKYKFVNLVNEDTRADFFQIQNTNNCNIKIFNHYDSSKIIIVSLIDNLLKGASGQAIQCMNLMFGFEEFFGL